MSKEVIEDANVYGDHHLQWLLEDGAERHFVHYLRSYSEYRHQPIYAGKVVLDRPAGRIIDFICQRLNRDAGRVRSKADWFGDYWNRTVASHGIFRRIEPGVTERFNSGGPTIMMRRIAGPASGSRANG